jgi:hypothetical protein
MKNVPHWQLLLLLYFVMVAIPVYGVHVWLKAKLLRNKLLANLLGYFAAVIGVAFLMNFICMHIYYTFFFKS